MTPASIAGELGCAVLLTFWVSSGFRGKPRAVRGAIALSSMGVALVPVRELSLAGTLRSLTGDLSITSVLLLCAGIFSLLLDRKLVRTGDLGGIMLFAGAGGLVFYPLALGLSSVDPYTWGYGSPLFLGSLLVLSLGAVVFERNLLALCTTTAVAAYAMGLYDSTNLWDYLLDPLLTVYALGWLLFRARLSVRTPSQT